MGTAEKHYKVMEIKDIVEMKNVITRISDKDCILFLWVTFPCLLDGLKVIMPFLPFNAKQWFINNEQIFYIVFVVLWITGLTSYIISPGIQAVSGWISNLAMAIWGL